MLINQDFSVDRTKYLGGSDIGAILGLSRFKSPLEVWMEKTGKEAKRIDSLPLRFGSFAESFVASEYSRSTGFELIHDQSTYVHPDHHFMSAHIDRFVLDELENAQRPLAPTRILECKTANPFTSSEWGEPGSDEVPMGYLCQCIWYMAITGMDRCDLAVLFGNSDFRIYEIFRDKTLEELVLQKATHFWIEHVQKDLPPPAINPQDCQTLFAKGDPNKTKEAEPATVELIHQLQLLNREIQTREEEVLAIKQHVMSQMGEAESLMYQSKTLATWKSPKPSYRLDAKLLEQEHPDLVSDYKVAIQNSRRLIFKQHD